MIKINLCPSDELENPNWWVPDALIVVVLAFAGIYFLQQHEVTFQTQIDEANRKREGFETSLAELKPDLDRAEELKKDNVRLNDLLVALQSITTSKIEKYKPIIVLEHLQSLKPEGVWYRTLNIRPDNEIVLEGQAFDNILIAEFAMALRATQNQDADVSDLRTQVQFNNLKITGITTSGLVDPNPAPGTGVPPMTGYPSFNMTFSIIEKIALPEPSAQPVSLNRDDGIRPRIARGK